MLALRLKPLRKSGVVGDITLMIPLDPEFYALQDVIDLVDESVYHDAELTLLTAADSSFTLRPERYGAISITEIPC